MKTTITMPDDLSAAAERAASRQGVSLPDFIVKALSDAVIREGDDSITESLNRIYGDEPSTSVSAWAASRNRLLAQDPW